MARHRTFRSTSARATDATAEPVTFTLEGGPPLVKEEWSETFTCLLAVPAGALDDLAASAGLDDRRRREWNAPSLIRFLMAVVVPEDEQRLWDTLHSKDKIIELDDLGATMMWLAEELTDLPTTPPSS